MANNTTLMVFNLSVCIRTTDKQIKEGIDFFIKSYYRSVQEGFGDSQEIKYYSGKVEDDDIYILYIKQFGQLYSWLRQTRNIDIKELSTIEDYREYEIDKDLYRARPHFQLRDNQKPVNEFVKNNPSGTRLVPLATGSGKTVIAMVTLAELNMKFGMIILPTFIDKWKDDICEIHDAVPEEIFVAQGKKSLQGIIQMAKEGTVPFKYFIFSNSTYNNYIKAFEEDPELCEEEYGCTPLELFPLLKLGVLLIDEAHMAFHIVFRCIIYTNVKYHVALSATLLTEDPVVRNVYNVLYPPESTYGQTLQQRYIDIYPVSYDISPDVLPRLRSTFRGSNNYSHVAYEQSIMSKQNKGVLRNYLRLINSLVEDFYIYEHDKGDKLLIFVATVNFATQLSDYLKETYPDKKVNRYCQEDPYEYLMESDICVSTVISSGTGVDIENLRVVIQTVSISSPVSNIQSLGRLRKLPNKDTKFVYTYSYKIGKQSMYHKKRVEMFRSKSKAIIHRSARVNL